MVSREQACTSLSPMCLTLCSLVEVLPGLYCGNLSDSKDRLQMEERGISHVVAVHDCARRIFKVSGGSRGGRGEEGWDW